MDNSEPNLNEQKFEKLTETSDKKSDFVPQPSTSGQQRNVKASVSSMSTGGGGAKMFHGHEFHLFIAILLLFSLKEECQTNFLFQYNIGLEKEGYGKFDDIVLQYSNPGGNFKQICVQCKHGEEKVNTDGTRTVNNITADDFLSGKHKNFSLAEYISSVVEIQSKYLGQETYFVILSNRAYVNDKDSSYPFFRREEISDIADLISFHGFESNCFKINYNDTLGEFLLKQVNARNQNQINITKKTVKEFFDQFIYICDNRDLDSVLQQKIAQHYCHNAETIMNRKARLYYFVSQMFQHKIHPTKYDIIDEFNGTNVYFKKPAACPQFSGRVNEIQRIVEALECEKKGTIFDLLVTGMAGMGKTQIVRKYIEDNRQKYKHVVWINAENEDTLEKSFVDLAKDCNLISSDCKYEVSDIVKTNYSFFKDQTLFVFDNASKVLISKNQENEYIYLPNNDQNKSKFIIISQDQQWITNHPRIVVDKFSEEDALIYLDASSECYKEDKIKLALTFQYWPLALCLAVSYIKLETENSLGRRNCSDIINNLQVDFFDTHTPKNHEMEPYTKNLNSLWIMIRNKLEEEHKLSIEILNILAFSHADNFPVELLQFDDVDENQVNAAVKTLKDNSIVIISDYKISIHRTLQSIIKNSIKIDDDHYESVLLSCTQCFHNYLHSMDPNEKINILGNFHMVTFLQHICQSKLDPQKYIKMANVLLKKLIESQDLKCYCETQGIFYQIQKVAEDALGVNHDDTLCTLTRTADMLCITGNFVESFNRIDNLLVKYTEKFGNKHNATLDILYQKASVLESMGKYEEALNIYNHVLEMRKEILGAKHPDLLCSLHNKASVLESMGKYEEALNIYNHVIEMRKEILGNKHPSLLTSMHNKASVLESMGKYEEALNIYHYVIEIETKTLGDKHPSLLTSMHNKASVLKSLGKYEEALNIYHYVIEIETEILGDKHPSLLASMHNKASVLKSMGKYEEALNIYNHVIEMRKEILLAKHPDLLSSLHGKASVLQDMGKYEEALNIYHFVIEIKTEILGDKHPHTISIIKGRDLDLESIRKYTERQCHIL